MLINRGDSKTFGQNCHCSFAGDTYRGRHALAGKKRSEAVMLVRQTLRTIFPLLCGAPASISCAVRTSFKGRTLPTLGCSSPLSNNFEIVFRRSVVTST